MALILHGTTELDFSGHPALTDVGQIGNERGRGFLQHNRLAVVPEPRKVLGLACRQLVVRVPAPAGESTYHRKGRRRESDLLRAGFRAPGSPPPGCRWVDVADRGADDYEGMRAAQEVGHDFLIRATQNRLAFVTPEHDRQEYLLDYARSLPGRGTDAVDIPGRGGRPARTARVALTASAVGSPAPTGTVRRKSQPPVAARVIRIWEPHPPADVAEPLEWLLRCSLPSETAEDLLARRDGYCGRWRIEVYHDIEKNGCREEDRRFETAARMATCLAVLSVVAVRVFQLRCALASQPMAPAEQAGTAAEVRLIRRFVKSAAAAFTVRDFVRGVAKRGGVLGHQGDGEPGIRALWRGYQHLQDMLVGFGLADADADADDST